MGHRLHYASTYKVKYGGGYCNHYQEEFNEFLYHLCACQWCWSNEEDIAYADEFEISKDVLNEAIERLKEYSDDELPTELQDANFSVAVIDAILKRCLEDSDPDNDYVRFSWF